MTRDISVAFEVWISIVDAGDVRDVPLCGSAFAQLGSIHGRISESQATLQVVLTERAKTCKNWRKILMTHKSSGGFLAVLSSSHNTSYHIMSCRVMSCKVMSRHSYSLYYQKTKQILLYETDSDISLLVYGATKHAHLRRSSKSMSCPACAVLGASSAANVLLVVLNSCLWGSFQVLSQPTAFPTWIRTHRFWPPPSAFQSCGGTKPFIPSRAIFGMPLQESVQQNLWERWWNNSGTSSGRYWKGQRGGGAKLN